MRAAFVGKGGSGKTTLSALFSRELAHSGAPVVAIDGDINQHLAHALGLGDDETFAAPPSVRGSARSRPTCAAATRVSPHPKP